MKKNLKNIQWQHYLTRHFNIFGASLWHKWYSSEHTMQALGIAMKDVLFIEEYPDTARHYRTIKGLKEFRKAATELVINNEPRYLALLREGESLNKEAEKALKKGPSYFKSLREAVDFLIRDALYATVLPYWAFLYSGECKNKEIDGLLKKIRMVSYYPDLVDRIIIPLAEKELKKQGIKDRKAIEVLTISEILEKKTKQAGQRLKEKKKGKRYVLQILGKKESVSYTDDVNALIAKIEKRDIGTAELKGQTAYPGKAKGIARIVISKDGKSGKFNKGDILVTIASNPNYVPLMSRSAAIVTDEGGITCHAAIISRELKVPCVIGTKIATRSLKDGDLILVDASKGIIKKLS